MKKLNGEDVRWGVFGAGDVCEVKSAPAMNLVENSKLVAVMRRNREKAKDYAKRHGVPRWYDQAEDLVNDPDINAIYIATPPGSHLELTRMAAAAGKPVYVEKPMARTYQECLDMIDACEKAGVPLYTAYYRRALPNFLKIKMLIDDGVIGDVRMVDIQLRESVSSGIMTAGESNWRVSPAISGGGYFFDLASHQLDFLDFLFGPITEAIGISVHQTGLYEAEDMVSGSFLFENGVMGAGSWCFSAGKVSDKEITTIVGSKGELEYPTFGESYIQVKTASEGTKRYDFTKPKHIQQPLIELVVGDLLGQATCPSTGLSGARTNRVMEKIVYG